MSSEERIDNLEKKLKELLKQKKSQHDAEVIRLRRKLSDELSEIILKKPVDDDSLAEKLWRLCFHKRIDEYRKQIGALPKGPPQKNLVIEFRQFLNEATQFFVELTEKIQNQNRVISRLFLSLGDIARYREMVNDNEEKKWTEAIDWYKNAAERYPQNGAAHNQLAVVATYQHRTIVAVYRYQRALGCETPFEAARENLSQLLIQSSKAEIDLSLPRAEVFASVCVRLQAYLLLPGQLLDDSVALKDLEHLRLEFPSLLKGRILRSEVTTSILLAFCFCYVYPLALGRSGQDDSRSTLVLDALRILGSSLLIHACSEIEFSKTNPDQKKNLFATKSLFPICLLVSFIRKQGFQILDETLKQNFDLLEALLSDLPLTSNDIRTLDEEEVEVSGFLPLGLEIVPINGVKHTADLYRRARKIRGFVRELIEEDLKQFSTNGLILSTHPPNKNGVHDDDEEEILFQPTFSTRSPPPVAETTSQPNNHNLTTTNLPGFYSFSSFSGDQTWGNGSMSMQSIPYQSGDGVDPFSWLSSKWSTSPPSARETKSVRPPPGFQ